MTVAEHGLDRADVNGTARPSPAAADLAGRVFLQAEKTPDAVAVAFGDDHLSYAELTRRSRAARPLIAGFGGRAGCAGRAGTGAVARFAGCGSRRVGGRRRLCARRSELSG